MGWIRRLVAMSLSWPPLSGLVAGAVTAAEPPTVAPVEWPAIVGFDPDGAADLSGIACGTPTGDRRSCVIVDDEGRRVRFATIEGRTITLGPDMAVLDKETVDPANGAKITNKEADLEAVARDGDVYWVVGSHGAKRHRGKGAKDCPPVPARRHLYRFEVDGATGLPTFPFDRKVAAKEIRRIDRLPEVLAKLPEIGPHVDAATCGDDGGFTIEGAAVAAGRMFLGVRAPLAAGSTSAFVVELDAEALAGAGDAGARLHRLPLGTGIGIRDMATVGDGILILAGPSGSDDGGRKAPSSVWFWAAAGGDPVALAQLGGVPDGAKPEGMAVLDQGPAGWRVLILSDGVVGGAPREYGISRHGMPVRR